MTVRIGLAVTHDTARVVVVKRGHAVWAGETDLPSDGDAREAISTLLRQVPVRWPRPAVTAVIGPHASQVKLVTGLPPVTDADWLAGILRQNAGTFFLKNGVPLSTTRVRLIEPGAVLAAALDQPWLRTIEEACKSAGLRLSAIGPTAAGLPGAFNGDAVQWTDGKLRLEISSRNGSPVEVRCIRSGTVEGVREPVEALAALGEQGTRFADAYGATTLFRSDPLLLGPDELRADAAGLAARRLLLPGMLAAASIVALLLAPLAAAVVGTRARRHLEGTSAQRRDAAALTSAELERVSATLRQIGSFSEARASVGHILAGIARVLPPQTVIRSLSTDSSSGQMEALTQNPASTLAALRRVPELTSVAFSGPIIRQFWAGREVQRVVITFRLGRRGGR